MSSQPNNPHASAADAYGSNAQKHTPDQREVEARVLLKAAKALQETRDNLENISHEELEEVLTYNRQIWLMFVDTAVEDEDPERPVGLRNNIASLGIFIFNHMLEVMADPQPEKFDILIEINREIAAGLMSRQDSGKDGGKETENTPEDTQA